MRVKCLLEAINFRRTCLHAAIATMNNDDGSRRQLSNFELEDSFLLPYDAVVNRKLSKGHYDNRAYVVDITTTTLSTSGSKKPSIRKTGVHLKWHNLGKFNKLSKDQRN